MPVKSRLFLNSNHFEIGIIQKEWDGESRDLFKSSIHRAEPSFLPGADLQVEAYQFADEDVANLILDICRYGLGGIEFQSVRWDPIKNHRIGDGPFKISYKLGKVVTHTVNVDLDIRGEPVVHVMLVHFIRHKVIMRKSAVEVPGVRAFRPASGKGQ